ncbi:MAG TPA: cell wall-active antibiotics response protein LiaF [Chondromyces sp.]|nr:cell wall-active antibiotics response protein LiaF [Chondromyces sp.]
MPRLRKKNWQMWLLAICLGAVLIELSLDKFFPLFFAAGFIYIGYRLRPRMLGTMALLFGLFLAVITLFNMISFRILLVVFLVYWFTRPNHIIQQPVEGESRAFITSKPYFKNHAISDQSKSDEYFALEDTNIQFLFSDIMIDLGMAVIPQGETTIIIRGITGNIQLLVPYDIEVKIHHNSWIGKTSIFQQEERTGWNQHTVLETPEFSTASRRIKIFTSIGMGDLEVKHI